MSSCLFPIPASSASSALQDSPTIGGAFRINALHDAHADDPTFGYRYLADEARCAGWRMSRRTAWKLCSQAGILSSAQRRRRGKGKKTGPPVFDDHVQRQFRADVPNRVWLTDITEHRTSEGKLYCCAIKDVHSNRIVGYSISDRMTAKLAVDALCNAVTRRGDVAGCILHADRGSQFRSRAMARELPRHDMVGSMGRVGAAGDNAAIESFWWQSQLVWATRGSRGCFQQRRQRLGWGFEVQGRAGSAVEGRGDAAGTFGGVGGEVASLLVSLVE